MPGLYYEQLEVGRRFVHDIRRTVTETDNVLFTTLTHNPAAIHLDAEASSKGPYGKVLVNSVFTLGLMVGVSVGDTTLGTTVANLGWDEVRFPKPVFVGGDRGGGAAREPVASRVRHRRVQARGVQSA
jgi:acyl dehydratase